MMHEIHVHQVQQKRWKIDTFSRLDSVLLLSAINLPGGILVSNKFVQLFARICFENFGTLMVFGI